MDLGFIGLGQMGSAIALNLVKAGHRVIVFNRTRAKAEALASQGAEVAESVADACRRPVVITMLADDAAVEAAFFGDGNGLSALGKGAVHISMSTISVALSDRLAEAHRNAGQSYVAAPVFGRPEAAAAAKLFVVAAGPEATARALPAPVRRDRSTDFRRRRQAVLGEPRQAQRQLPARGDDRMFRRSLRAHPQRRS